MVVLGVDPGTLITGYGIIEGLDGKLLVLTSGAIRNDSQRPMPLRLKLIHRHLTELIDQFRPDEFAIETAFYGKNAQSALKLGQARGAALIAAISHDIPTFEYSPREVKKAIVGNGAASKEQIQFMVKSLLHLTQLPKHLDTTDALAVALCHIQRRPTSSRHIAPARSWKAFVRANPDKLVHSVR